MVQENFFGDMSFGEALETSLNQAIEHAQGKRKLRTQIKKSIPDLKNFKGEDIKNIRLSINCTQEMFSKIMGVSVSTIEYWESGKNKPSGSAQRLLSIIKNKKMAFLDDLEILG